MSDNTTLSAMTGGDVIATEDLGGGVKIQIVKLATGDHGAASDVAADNPLPTTMDSGTQLQRIELLELAVRALLAGAGAQPHDGLGRTRISLEAATATVPISAATSLAVSGVQYWGGQPTAAAHDAIRNGAASALRTSITVS